MSLTPVRLDGLEFLGAADIASHIADHLLSSPERLGWMVLCPELRDLLGAERPEREALVRRMFRGEADAEAARLYAGYAAVVGRAIKEARRCQLVTRQDSWEAMLGLDGVFVVVAGSRIVTSYLAIADWGPTWVEREGVDRERSPLPREERLRLDPRARANITALLSRPVGAALDPRERFLTLFEPAARFVSKRDGATSSPREASRIHPNALYPRLRAAGLVGGGAFNAWTRCVASTSAASSTPSSPPGKPL